MIFLRLIWPANSIFFSQNGSYHWFWTILITNFCLFAQFKGGKGAVFPLIAKMLKKTHTKVPSLRIKCELKYPLGSLNKCWMPVWLVNHTYLPNWLVKTWKTALLLEAKTCAKVPSQEPNCPLGAKTLLSTLVTKACTVCDFLLFENLGLIMSDVLDLEKKENLDKVNLLINNFLI